MGDREGGVKCKTRAPVRKSFKGGGGVEDSARERGFSLTMVLHRNWAIKLI